ncbi:MAG: hypothetical protein RL113_589 [Pseudomonadota bacterium]
MKQLTLLSLITASLLFVGCGEETKKAAAEATASTTEAVKNDVTNSVESVKAKTEEVVESVKETASEVVEDAQAKVEETVDAAQALMAPAVFDKCKSCHGANGQQQALGKSAIIAGQDKAQLIASMKAYQAGEKNEVGMGGLMKGQLASVTDEDIEAIADYLSKQ